MQHLYFCSPRLRVVNGLHGKEKQPFIAEGKLRRVR